jgi:hypothetical protein
MKLHFSLRRLLAAIGLFGLSFACAKASGSFHFSHSTFVQAALLVTAFAVFGCTAIGTLFNREGVGAVIGLAIGLWLVGFLYVALRIADV